MKYVADVKKDGLLDIVFTFRFGDTGFKCSDIPSGQNKADVNRVLTGIFERSRMVGRKLIVEKFKVDGTDVLKLIKIPDKRN
jgi:hypothetical protein